MSVINHAALTNPVQHLLLAGAIEVDGELVAFDGSDITAAELLVEDAVAKLDRYQLTVDDATLHRAAPGAVSRPAT